MYLSRFALVVSLALLTACSSSNRPVYSGHQESTEGVPGFSKGKKLSPHVKLGQSYRINGETYVPRHQPDYVEEGMASWYGPGFHGRKTANGERFDEDEMTAAHRTLPLPSIVRVTMLSTGKQAYVRVNDRGPFAHNRIIDVSRGVAEKIGLIRSGVGKVRVEYMDGESQRFADLLADGRDPQSIDIEDEILNASYAQAPSRAAPSTLENNAARGDDSNEIETSALDNRSNQAAPLPDVSSSDLAAPIAAKATPAPAVMVGQAESPFAALEEGALPEKKQAPQVAASLAPAGSVVTGESFVQIGAFQNEGNAERLRSQFAQVQGLSVVKKVNSNGITLYHVRKGPFADAQLSNKAAEELQAAGADAKIVKH